jgi:S-adenosylmethionine:tRNA ribosyltransferase-isomerase
VRRALLDYELPPELIASRPAKDRDGARLLVVDPARDALTHAAVSDLAELLPHGALLVVNDTRVIPARLLGVKESGGRVELFLVRKLNARADRDAPGIPPASAPLCDGPPPTTDVTEERWQALGRASKPLRPGARITLERAPRVVADGARPADDLALTAHVARRLDDGALLEVVLSSPSGAPIDRAIEAFGHVPLPPYLRRADEDDDRERYQTVFARVPGAVAAPTAGLHLSEALLERIRARGVEIAAVTLHVGLGTFQPVTAEDLDDHPMHAEWFEVPAATAAAIARARDRGAPVVAIGTTVVRALESAASEGGDLGATSGETRLLIQPGYRFRVVDQLFTNFHLPQSTLLALVAAFAGRERVLCAYRSAVEARYRFFSYGDAMLVRARAADTSEAESR